MPLDEFRDWAGTFISHVWPNGTPVLYEDGEKHIYCVHCANENHQNIITGYVSEYSERCHLCSIRMKKNLHPDLVPYLNYRNVPNYPHYPEVSLLNLKEGKGYITDSRHRAYLPMQGLTTGGWHPYLISNFGLIGFYCVEHVQKFFQGGYDWPFYLSSPAVRELDKRVVGRGPRPS